MKWQLQGLKARDVDLKPIYSIAGLSEEDLSKPGNLLTAEEFAIMKNHPAYGRDAIKAAEKLLENSETSFLRFAREIAYTHHEKWDGSGSPSRIEGESIPLASRIVAIADVFDALLSERPYKQAWSLERTLELISSQSGRHFDPDCVEALLLNLDRILSSRGLAEDSDEPKAG